MGKNKSLFHLPVFFGSFLGAGFLKPAPGTWGTIAALPFIYGIWMWMNWPGLVLFFLITCAITLLAAPGFERLYGNDPSEMVSDEAAGIALPFAALAYLDIPFTLLIIIACFAFFRFFDILKPLGIGKLQNLPSGWGILLDDVLAGIYTFLSVYLLILIIL